MAEEARVASAFIEIKARRAFSAEDIRRMGQESGREFDKSFEQESEKGFQKAAPRRRELGKKAGQEIGDAAGKEAGDRTAKGLEERLRDSRGRWRKSGDDIGDEVGGGTDRSFRSRFLGGISRTSRSAAKTLESDISQGLARGFKRGLTGAAGVGALASSASGLGTVLSGTVGAVVQLSGAVGVLPGAFAAAGAATGALKLGVTGVGDALKDSGDPKKYAEDIKALSPAARSFTDAVVKLRPQLKALKNSVQDGLFKGADKEVKALGDRYLPVMKTRLTEITGEFNRGGRSVADYLDHAKQSKDVDGILDNTRRSVGHLADAFKPVAGALLDIVKVGSDELPGLTKQVDHAAERLAGMVKSARNDGSMKRFFQGGIDAAKDLARVGQGAGRILGGIFAAGGGANTNGLATLAALLGKVADQVNSPAFQHGLGDFFSSIGDAGSSVGGALPKVADALVAIEPAAAALVRGAGKALAATLTTASGAAISLAPTLNVLAGALEGVSPHVGPLILVLIGLKGALLGLKAAASVVDALDTLDGRLDKVGLSAARARVASVGFSGALKGLGVAGVVVGAAALARALDGAIGRMSVGRVDADKLSASLRDMGRGGKLGGAGLELFTNHGLFGLKNSVSGTTEAITHFQNEAEAAFGTGLNQKLGRLQNGSLQLERLKKQAQQLDPALAALSRQDPSAASGAFAQFTKGLDPAVLAQVTALFPQFQSAVRASGATIDATTGKVTGLGRSLSDLTQQTADYADKALAARGSSRGYQAALDTAREAAKRNGDTLKETTARGRENADALDGIAAAGIRYAQSILNSGGSETKFQGALRQTRADLVQAGVRFGLSKAAAERYADSVLKIPKSVSTSIAQYGIQNAITNARNLADRLSHIPRKVITLVRTDHLDVFASETQRDAATARRHASGGLIDRGLGGPRQDNVPAWLSAGEFVVNARAVAYPGVENLLRTINSQNRVPRYAGGGYVSGLGDLSASQPARIARMEAAAGQQQAAGPARMHPDDIALIVGGFAAAVRQQRIVLDSGAVAGAVYEQGGRVWG